MRNGIVGKLNRTRKAILKNKSKFDYASIFAPGHCGTAGCIGGWAFVVASEDGVVMDGSPIRTATRWLDLTDREEDALFFGNTLKPYIDRIDKPFREVTAKEAAKRIDQFINYLEDSCGN
jgi:hypothetical protein